MTENVIIIEDDDARDPLKRANIPESPEALLAAKVTGSVIITIFTQELSKKLAEKLFPDYCSKQGS